MARIVDLNITKYAWIPGDAGLTTPSAPKTTELTAAGVKDISPFVLATTSVNPTGSDTVNERSITDVSNNVVPTIGNYEGQLNLFRDFASGAATTSDVFDLFRQAGTVGWVVKRIGLASGTAFAAGQKVSTFKFMTDNPMETGGTGEGFLKLMVPMLQQGSFYQNVTTVL